jgi:uncharacterized membrane protein
MSVLLLALGIGIVAGLRAMTAPAAVSWAARLGWLHLADTGLAFLSNGTTCIVLTVLALAELVTDQLPSTPSRTVPVSFATRVVSGAISGGAVATAAGALGSGLAAGAVGAVIGTLVGRDVRARLAAGLGADRPAALIEDAVALAGAALIVLAVS